MADASANLSIGAFAKAAGVNVETIRFYQRKGLLPQPQRPYGSIRRYGQADVARVKFVKSAQRLGFSLAEAAQLLALDDGTQCNDARHIAERHWHEVRRKLADLRAIESRLRELVDRCGQAQGQVNCPLIGAIKAEQSRLCSG